MVVQSLSGLLQSSKVGRAERQHQRRPGRRRGPGDQVRQRRRQLAGTDPGAGQDPGHPRHAPQRRDSRAVHSRAWHGRGPGQDHRGDGPVVPTSRPAAPGIELLGGSAVSIALPSLGGVAGAVEHHLERAGDATMLVPGGPAGHAGRDRGQRRAGARAGRARRQPGAARPGRPQLVLSAPGRRRQSGSPTATATSSAAGQAGQVVQIKAGSSVVVPVAPPTGSKATQFTVVVTPLSGSGRSTRAGSSPPAGRCSRCCRCRAR